MKIAFSSSRLVQKTHWSSGFLPHEHLRRVGLLAIQKCGIVSALALVLTPLRSSAVDGPESRIDNATCVADVSSWADEGFTFYRWLTTHQILFLRHPLHLFAYSDENRAVNVLLGFNAAFDRSRHDPVVGGVMGGDLNGYNGFDVAYGGNRVLWYCYPGNRAYVANISGEGYHTTDLISRDSWQGRCEWLNGRDKWIEFTNDDDGNFRVRIHSSKGYYDVGLPPATFGVEINLRDVRCLDKGRSVQAAFIIKSQDKCNTETLSIGGRSVPAMVRRYCAPIPGEHPNRLITEAVISPHCDRVAWIVALDGSKTAPPMLALYVSSIDLKRMHALTAVECSRPFYEPPIRSIRWLPDQSAVSFVYKSKLWKLPVKK